MATRLFEHVQTKVTPQTEPVAGKPTVPNSAGGYSFAVDDWKRLERFLILSTEGGTYYVSERKLTQENAQCVARCLVLDAKRTVETIVEISEKGRAPKNDAAVFALALCASSQHTNAAALARQLALSSLTRVCRTGTHLFQFAAACNALRGWGSGLRRAVGKWYTDKDAEQLGYQLAKYQQRDGWSHRDILRLCHVKGAANSSVDAALRWAVVGKGGVAAFDRTVTRGKGDKAKIYTYPGVIPDMLPKSIKALEALNGAADAEMCANLLRLYGDKATREMVPTQFLTDPNVWEALLETMPMTAMLRNLANMTKCGLVAPLSNATRVVCERLRDVDRLKKARVHPLSVLNALRTYASGRSVKGDGVWSPVQAVVDALDDAFYLAFDAIEPAGKRFVYGLDVSGSMSAAIAGMPLSCAEASAALALVSARTEPYSYTGMFTQTWQQAPFGTKTRLDDALRITRGLNFGGTDCAMPMLYAQRNKLEVDTFVVLTDSETYAGAIHPFQALQEYRQKTGIPAKMVVVGMTATEFTIADPSDAGMLDIAGFSTDCPALMSDFARN